MANNKKVSAPEQLKEAINSMMFSKLTIDKKEYFLKNKHKQLAAEIFAVLKIKQPENLLSKEQIKEYMDKRY